VQIRSRLALLGCAFAGGVAARSARADAPPLAIMATVDADLRIGPWLSACLSPKVEALGRVSEGLLVGALANYGLFPSGNSISLGYDNSGQVENGRSHVFHAMGELRWIRHPWDVRRQFWLAGDAGLGGAYTTGEQLCAPNCPPPHSSVVLGPALGFQTGLDVHLVGPTWFEFSGHLTVDRFVGPDPSAYWWIEWGVSVGLRFGGPWE
jgi:hypothetical protein